MTEETKQKLLNAKTEEEAKSILASVNEELTDDELEMIAGGAFNPFEVIKKGFSAFFG